jgi:hypothetical protein
MDYSRYGNGHDGTNPYCRYCSVSGRKACVMTCVRFFTGSRNRVTAGMDTDPPQISPMRPAISIHFALALQDATSSLPARQLVGEVLIDVFRSTCAAMHTICRLHDLTARDSTDTRAAYGTTRDQAARFSCQTPEIETGLRNVQDQESALRRDIPPLPKLRIQRPGL